ncbi:SDR family NAD(P)-dependent oxidoreductase [Gryllotalpicola daejeonensis]
MAQKQVVVITGASSGIGRDAALRFARRGAQLVLVSRRGQVLEDVAAECVRKGAGDAVAVAADVSDEAQVQNVVGTAFARFGRIDVWVNDAGVDAYGPLDQLRPDEIRRVFDVNVTGTALGTRAALRAMKRAGRGTIVNVSSVLGEVPQPYAAAYSASKAAIRALSAAVRSELALEGHRHIHVSVVIPATTDTPAYRHSANRSGRKLRAMPPVYPVSAAGKAIVRAAVKHPREVAANAAGRIFVPMHRLAPTVAEAELAQLTKRTQFTRGRAEGTSGNLFEPFPDADASVGGGWRGGARQGVNRVLLIAAAAVPIWWFMTKAKKGAKR